MHTSQETIDLRAALQEALRDREVAEQVSTEAESERDVQWVTRIIQGHNTRIRDLRRRLFRAMIVDRMRKQDSCQE